MINNKAIAKLEDAGDHLAPLLEKDPATFTDRDMTSLTLMSANSTLDEGKDILFHRQKLIKLADKSDAGWKIVEEYESNELTDNSDDEKRIAKAEARASRKIRESSRSGGRSMRGGVYRGRTGWFPSTSYRGDYSHGRTPGDYGHRSATETSATATGARFGSTGGRPPGLCFACGRQGHWRQDCPTVKATEGKGHHEKLSIHSKIGIFKASDLLIERHTCKPKSSNIISPVGRLRSQYNNWANITSVIF